MYAAPTGVPQNFSAIPGQTNITFVWSSPVSAQRNGVIIGYVLSCMPKVAVTVDAISAVFTMDGSVVVSGFQSSTEYNCSIFAKNDAGNGPSLCLSVTTIDDSELI